MKLHQKITEDEKGCSVAEKHFDACNALDVDDCFEHGVSEDGAQ